MKDLLHIAIASVIVLLVGLAVWILLPFLIILPLFLLSILDAVFF